MTAILLCLAVVIVLAACDSAVRLPWVRKAQ